MDEFREYTTCLRELELENVCLLVHDNLSPYLNKYIKLIKNATFEDGAYDRYYGEVKKIISSFAMFYNEKIDITIKEVDKFMNTSNVEILLELCDRTIETFKKKQMNFAFEFLPVQSAAEKDRYNTIELKSNLYLDKLEKMRIEIQRLDKQFRIDAFAAETLPASLHCDYERFKFTHLFLSRMIASRIRNIDTSLSEVMIKVCHVFTRLQTQFENEIITLLHKLYKVDREALRLRSRDQRCTINSTEVQRSIELIRQKIDALFPQDTPLRHLEEEIQYWTKKSQEIDYIATALIKLKDEKQELEQRELELLRIETEYPSSAEALQVKLNEDMVELKNVQDRLVDVNNQYDAVARCLFTFLSLRGSNKLYYNDQVGKYHIDEYGHKVYSFDYGLELCFLQNDGTFVDIDQFEGIYFNEYGNYIYEESTGDASLVTLSTLSSISRESLFIADANEDDALKAQQNIQVKSKAKLDQVDISVFNISAELGSGTDSDKYLWDTFGSILPEALRDVFLIKPKNPLHYLAHTLLRYKYTKNNVEAKNKKKEAKQFWDNVFLKKIENAKEEATAWKSKLPKRSKPEDCYDIENQIIESNEIVRHDFILGYNFTNEIM